MAWNWSSEMASYSLASKKSLGQSTVPHYTAAFQQFQTNPQNHSLEEWVESGCWRSFRSILPQSQAAASDRSSHDRKDWEKSAALLERNWTGVSSGLRFLHCQVQPGERNSYLVKRAALMAELYPTAVVIHLPTCPLLSYCRPGRVLGPQNHCKSTVKVLF